MNISHADRDDGTAVPRQKQLDGGAQVNEVVTSQPTAVLWWWTTVTCGARVGQRNNRGAGTLAFHLANRRPQLLLLLGLLGLCGLGTAGLADGSTKPAMTIIMERGELLENQTTSLTVWIENPTDARMTDIHFSYAGPKFLQIGTFAPDNKTCAVVSKDIDFGAIEPGSALQPPRRLCLQAGSPIDERDESLGFSVAYTLVKDGKATSGFVVAEKKLSVGLFGTESIGGVSLRLAAYVIPGLLFMMILRLGGF